MIELFESLNIKENDYFLTGSRALDFNGCIVSNHLSDHDYVLRIEYRHILEGYLKHNKINVNLSCYNGGFKFTHNNKNINIITCIDIEFMAWREALYIIKMLMRKDKTYLKAVKNKIQRYCLYETLRAVLKQNLAINYY